MAHEPEAPRTSAPSWPKPCRLLLDTNVVVAALLWNGPPRRLLDMALNEDVLLVSSPALINELEHTLGYERLAKRILLFQTTAQALAQQYTALVTLTEPGSVPPVVVDDPDDDAVVAAALAANVDCIVSGDRHLLGLHGKIAVPVLKAAQVLVHIGA